MSDVKGSERNPICLDNDAPAVISTEYYSLIDGDDPVPLSTWSLPATSRVPPRRKSSRQSTNVPPGNVSSHRRASPEPMILSCAPSAKPASRHGTVMSAIDEMGSKHRSTSQRGAISHSFTHDRATTPPTKITSAVASNEEQVRHRFTPRRGAISYSFRHDRATTPSANTANATSSATRLECMVRNHQPSASTLETPDLVSDSFVGRASQQTSRNSASIAMGQGQGNMLSCDGSSNARAKAHADNTIIVDQSNLIYPRSLPSPRHLKHPIGKTGDTTARENIATQVESVVEGSTETASGSRADAHREQTNPRRVGSDAPVPSMHNQHDSESRSASRQSVSRKQNSQKCTVVKERKKPRAVKSAEQRRPGIEKTPQLSGDSHAQPSTSLSRSNIETHIERPTAAHPLLSQYRTSPVVAERPEEDITTTEDAPELQQVGPQTENEASPLFDVESIVMGAQLSTLSSVATPPEEPPANATSTASGKQTSIDQTVELIPNALEERVSRVNGNSVEHPDDADERIYTDDLIVDVLDDIDAAHRKVEASLQRHLEDRYEDHAYLVKNLMWRQRTCYERDLRSHTNGTAIQWDTSPRLKFEQLESPFGNMRDMQSMFAKSHVSNTEEMTQEIFIKFTSKVPSSKTIWSVPAITYMPEELQIPSFKEYVSLKTNILADNESKILTLPYLGDDEPEDRQQVLRNDLPRRYEILHDENACLDLRQEQCNFYYDTVEAFLRSIGVTWDTMIYWLLSSATDLQRMNRASVRCDVFEKVVEDRAPYDKEFFSRDGNDLKTVLFEPGSDNWTALLYRLQKPSAEQLRVIALAGAALVRHCDFSPWYLVKRCKTMQNYVHAKLKLAKDAPDFTFRDIICRICHEHDCIFHGQIRENPCRDPGPDLLEGPSPSDPSQNDTHDDESDVEIAHYDSDDSDVEKVINFKFPVNPGPPDDGSRSHLGAPSHRHAVPPAGAFKARWWESNTETTNWENRKPFVPCNHHGSCIEAKCRCFRENITCEKTCKCPLTCNRRFPGCKCAQMPGRRTCSTATGCLCVKFERECDADLCGTCGATEVLDPTNRHNEEVLLHRCRNVELQRGVPIKTLLGKSEVHGFGLYAGEDVCKSDHIGEYVGEIISSSESQRREIVYSYQKNMYLFRLNEEQEVDATHMGNKLRFINNANKGLSNCFCRVVFCNTVFRVALIASSDIKAGTELFFHYNYPEDMTRNFKQPKGKVVAVKQLVKQTNKAKTKRASSRSSSNNESYRPIVDNPRILAATAKARAAKKAKREAMLAEKGLGVAPLNTTSRSVRPARKSAGSSSLLPVSRESSARGRPRRARGATSRDESAASGSFAEYNGGVSVRRQRSATPVVQETDDEDDEFVFGSTQGEGGDAAERNLDDSGKDSQAEAGAQDATALSSSRLRTRAMGPASVVAVKEVKKKKGGARPGAGRKRKRPLVLNSEDEV